MAYSGTPFLAYKNAKAIFSTTRHDDVVSTHHRYQQTSGMSLARARFLHHVMTLVINQLSLTVVIISMTRSITRRHHDKSSILGLTLDLRHGLRIQFHRGGT